MPPRKKAAARKLTAAERNCKLHCCNVSAERGAEIAASAKETNVQHYGPACHCGLRGAKEACPRHG